MDKLKFTLFSIVVLFLIGLIGYWAVVTLQSGTDHASSQKIKELEQENSDLSKQVDDLTGELSTLQSQVDQSTKSGTTAPADNSNAQTTAPATYKYQSLVDELQKLVSDKVFMKLKSSGTRVGTVQKFLNIYNNTSNKVDNDYGTSTEKAVAAFQKAEGLTADGEAGPGTFAKMIDWLKGQQ